MTVHRNPEELPEEKREESFIIEEPKEENSDLNVNYFIEEGEPGYIVEEVLYEPKELEQ